GGLKKRLGQPAVMKCIGDETTEVAETIDEDPDGLSLAYRFRHLRRDRPALHLRWRKDIVDLVLGEGLGRRRQIEDIRGIQIEPDRFRIRAYMIRRLSERDHQYPFARRQAGRDEMHSHRGFPR